jgi:hypothetical protein
MYFGAEKVVIHVWQGKKKEATGSNLLAPLGLI